MASKNLSRQQQNAIIAQLQTELKKRLAGTEIEVTFEIYPDLDDEIDD